MYRNINNLIESIKYQVDNSDDTVQDIIHEIVDIEVSNNSWRFNKMIIEDDYNTDIIDAIIKYNNTSGDDCLFDENDKIYIYARIAYMLIIDETRKEFTNYIVELNEY